MPTPLALLLTLAAATPPPASDGGSAIGSISILAPGTPGGGYDLTAQALRLGLEASGAASDIHIDVSPGAGGMVGLAQFLARRGDESALFIGGLALLSAIQAQQARVSVLDATPLARLAGEHQVVVVDPSSTLRSLTDLVGELQGDPERLVWAGGPQGSADNAVVVEIARAARVSPDRVSYLPVGLTGQEVAEAVLGGHARAGVSWYSELREEIEAGRLRALAISALDRVPSIQVPTFREQGLDVVATNWRGVFGAPGLEPAAVARTIGALDHAVRTPAWKSALRENQWSDLYLAGEPFVEFVRSEAARIQALPTPPAPSGGPQPGSSRPLWTWLGAAVLGVAALGVFLWRRAVKHERALEQDLEGLRRALQEALERGRDRTLSVDTQIQGRFDEWNLTAAERAVAMLILTGRRYREIATNRKTSERTVREQAFGIFKKAGLAGRSDLAAYFLRDLLEPQPTAPGAPDSDSGSDSAPAEPGPKPPDRT